MEAGEENPFAALIEEPDLHQAGTKVGISHDLIEEIFLFRLFKSKHLEEDKSVICLSEIVSEICRDEPSCITEEILGHVLFERLMLCDAQKYLLNGKTKVPKEALEKHVITYLFRAFENCERLKTDQSKSLHDFEIIKNIIFSNISTCIRQPELFQNQSFSTQWFEILKENRTSKAIQDFLVHTILQLIEDEGQLNTMGILKALFYPMLTEIQKQTTSNNLISFPKSTFWIFEYFVNDKRTPQLGEVLIDFTTPNPNATGGEYMDTLFGQLFCISILPKRLNGPFEYFNNPFFEAQHSDPSLWQLMSIHQNSIFILLKQLLVLGETTKKKTLSWIANCLKANVTRGHLWNNINLGLETANNITASDSFMISLCAILLRFSEPLCEPTMKVLHVDPTYCAVIDSYQLKQILLKSVKETFLLPTEENEIRFTVPNYNFVTEIFFITHKAYQLGYRACVERFNRMTRELHNVQSSYRDIENSDPNSELATNMLKMLKEQMQQYLCFRNGLMEPQNDTIMLKFFEATAIWLTEIVLINEEKFEKLKTRTSFAPYERKNQSVPEIIEYVPPYLKYIPEYLIDNIISYLNFSRHFPTGQFIEVYKSSHIAFFKMIILFMGNSVLIKNPHLRAKLAEALEFFLPKKKSENTKNIILSKVFDDHPDRLNIVRSLLNVFVSIEMTGQSVQFEQKFNYRRPMYAIMEFLWTKEEQVNCFKALADEAELNMEATEPPLFLRFVNLLINDAIFLLDESLSNLQQIRQIQEHQTTVEWTALTSGERQQQLTNLHQLGTLARIDNILGRDTINILKLISSEIKSIFCHNSMVERIAAMLNYFLLNLVGPQKEKFKVKNKKEFEFDPAQTVLEICHIYINLSSNERFCLAVSQDGRSYNNNLFSYTEKVLIRIGGGQLIGDLSDFALKVQKIEIQYREEKDLLIDAPEDFLDPIMSTLMTDPVILPTSNITVDRCTIARHLLSDQTDPFNRDPLTMDKVKPNENLKLEIEKWIEKKKKKFEKLNI